MYLQNRNRLTDIEKELWLEKGKRESVLWYRRITSKTTYIEYGNYS